MATIFKKQITEQNTEREILNGIIKVANDKNTHVLLADCVEWLEIKMQEVKRLALLLRKKQASRKER